MPSSSSGLHPLALVISEIDDFAHKLASLVKPKNQLKRSERAEIRALLREAFNAVQASQAASAPSEELETPPIGGAAESGEASNEAEGGEDPLPTESEGEGEGVSENDGAAESAQGTALEAGVALLERLRVAWRNYGVEPPVEMGARVQQHQHFGAYDDEVAKQAGSFKARAFEKADAMANNLERRIERSLSATKSASIGGRAEAREKSRPLKTGREAAELVTSKIS